MDVICERCKAEYEFDEALLGEKGTTVKCSACGHVFRVLPPHHELARSHLKLRSAKDGQIRALASLRELQQCIRAGEVSLDDELGRDGFPFRALREVPELKNFFGPAASASKTPYEKTTVQPNASVLGAESAGKTVEGRVPGSQPGATMSGQPAPRAPSTRPPLPSERARQDPSQPLAVAPYSEAPPEPEARAAHSSQPTLPPEARNRAFTKQTMMGVGPADLQLPPPPRIPSFGAADTARGAVAQPVHAVSNAAARDAQADRREPSEQRAAAEPPANPHATLRGRPAPDAPVQAPPPRSGTTSPQYAPASRPEPQSELVPAHEVPASQAAAASTNALVARLQSGQPSVLEVPDSARKLYLEDDERGPPRVEDSSSKLGLTVLLLLVLGGGGYLGWMAVEGPEGEYYEASANEPSEEPDAAVDSLETANQAPAEAVPDPVPSAIPGEPAADKLASVSADSAVTNAATSETPASEPAAKSEATPLEATTPQPAAREPTAHQPVAREPAAREPVAREPAAQSEPPSREPAGDKPAKVNTSPKAEAKPAAVAARPAAGEDYSALVSKGDQLDSRGDHDGAQRAFRAALAVRPAGSEANAGLGFALLSMGKAREALPYFDTAANSGYAEANIGLGDAYRKLGQPSSAVEAYQAYLDRLPRGQRADYARTQIDKLKNGGAPTAARNDPYRPAGELIAPSAPAQPNENPP